MNIDIRAIVFGSLADWIGTMLFSISFYSLISLRLLEKGLTAAEIQTLYNEWSAGTDGFIFMLFFGLCFTFYGGYIAAKISRKKTLLNSSIVGLIAMVSGLFFMNNISVVQIISSLILMIPVSTTGGYYYLKQWIFFSTNEDKRTVNH